MAEKILSRVLKKDEPDIRQYYATLLAVAFDGENVIAFHQGDGLIANVDYKGNASVISSPDNGEYANSTYFITDPESVSHFRISKYEFDPGCDGNAVFLMSDGVEKCFYSRVDKEIISSELLRWLANCAFILPRSIMCKVLARLLKDDISKFSDDDLSIGVLAISSDYIVDEILDIPQPARFNGSMSAVQRYISGQKKELKDHQEYQQSLEAAGVMKLIDDLQSS